MRLRLDARSRYNIFLRLEKQRDVAIRISAPVRNVASVEKSAVKRRASRQPQPIVRHRSETETKIKRGANLTTDLHPVNVYGIGMDYFPKVWSRNV